MIFPGLLHCRILKAPHLRVRGSESKKVVKKNGNDGNPRRRRESAGTSAQRGPHPPAALRRSPRLWSWGSRGRSRGGRAGPAHTTARGPPPHDWRLQRPITAALAPAAPGAYPPGPGAGRGLEPPQGPSAPSLRASRPGLAERRPQSDPRRYVTSSGTFAPLTRLRLCNRGAPARVPPPGQ